MSPTWVAGAQVLELSSTASQVHSQGAGAEVQWPDLHQHYDKGCDIPRGSLTLHHNTHPWVQVLYQIGVFQMFSPIIWLAFPEHRFLILIKYNWSIAFFHELCFWCFIWKLSPKLRSPRFSPMFSLFSFVVYKSMVCFELIFMEGIKSVSRFFFHFYWIANC